ncbi:MAG: PD-(D/E)XK nuclease-like domain-containing protein [Ruminococcus sp.]|nr:PD-(D/E)XK nuclease-like domain-containing protein [Ruminococcus sp.]MDE7226289.1 PD-(D/E)XK nuclease-like domain-containing protein [Ruminococcus sp.]
MDNPLIMTNAEYHAYPAVSKSDLDLIDRSPAYYRHIKENPRESTPAMLLGSVVHKLILEPDSFASEYAVCPAADRRTKAGREIYQTFTDSLKNGVEAVPDDVYRTALSMAESVRNHPIASRLLQGGQAETSWFWEENGIQCKCRPDYLRTDIKCVIDLKTTQNSSLESFTKSAYDYRYHVQVAWYLKGLRTCGVEAENFLFVAVEKEPPYPVCVHAADDLMIQLGGQKAMENLTVYAECQNTGIWYGYEKEPEIHSLSLPDWVVRKYF